LGTVSRPAAAGSVDPDTLAVALKHAIEICLVGDRRIGLALSGGLDSTLIAGVVDSLGIEDINTVSLTIEGSPDGLATLHALGLPKHGAWRTWRHARVHIEPRMLPKAIARAVAIMGEPIRMTSVPLYCALAGLAAQQGITVLLLGEGSDELFLGYESYRTFFATLRSRAASLADVLAEFACPAVQREWTKRLVGRAALDGALERLRSIIEAESAEAPEDALRRLEYTLSLEPLLLRSDHALMSHGIEGRTPFLHGAVPVIGSAARQHDLLDEATGKVLLHRTASRLLPGVHPWPPKRPFRAPIAAWFNGELGRWTSRRIRQSSPSLEVVGIRPRGVEELALAVEAGDGRVAPVAFAVLCLAAWVESLEDVGGGTAAASGAKRPSRPRDE
jgi:asparagine synthase (glutamine-hydrolysing)